MVPEPNNHNDIGIMSPYEYIADETLGKLVAPQAGPRKYTVDWLSVVILALVHLAAIYGLFVLVAKASWPTVIFNCLTFYLSVVGSCAGAHRLWSHRSYKATWPLQVFLMLCHCLSHQYSIFVWARDHRMHHKYSDTDGDPYNASRGFWYSHVAWLVVNRHPEVLRRMKLVDMTDILANPVVMFQKRNRIWLNFTFAFVIPTLLPVYLWNETIFNSFYANSFRLILSVNGTFSINSLAHMFGPKPYDKNISPSQNIVTTLLTFGEGFHNYHHTFPYDYKAGELGSFLNFSASFIYWCGKLGLAYDLKEVSPAVLEQRMARTGDRSLDKHGITFLIQNAKNCVMEHR